MREDLGYTVTLMSSREELFNVMNIESTYLLIVTLR